MCIFKLFSKKSNCKKGKKYEKKISKYLGKKVIITDRRKIYSFNNKARYAEIDIETPSTAIEVKSGAARGLKKQLDRYSDVTKKEPVALAPNMKPNAKKNTRKYYKVFDKKRDLRNYLISKGDGRKYKRRKYNKYEWIIIVK